MLSLHQTPAEKRFASPTYLLSAQAAQIMFMNSFCGTECLFKKMARF